MLYQLSYAPKNYRGPTEPHSQTCDADLSEDGILPHAKVAGQSRVFGREESPGFTGQRAG